ncbi:MAG: CHAP domain-containing protein, partial [Oscillospiraceae bacterium]|nr:CHAP domain-containing protein [Oscillospiraceae bacterium]
MGQVERLLEIAKSDVGVKESPPNSNRCKFNTWYYGKEVSGSAYPWCMAAVQYWFNQAGLSSLIMRTASCTALMNWAKQRKQFVTSGYRPGDVALYQFDSDPESEHTGIIV